VVLILPGVSRPESGRVLWGWAGGAGPRRPVHHHHFFAFFWRENE